MYKDEDVFIGITVVVLDTTLLVLEHLLRGHATYNVLNLGFLRITAFILNNWGYLHDTSGNKIQQFWIDSFDTSWFNSRKIPEITGIPDFFWRWISISVYVLYLNKVHDVYDTDFDSGVQECIHKRLTIQRNNE